MAQRRNITQPDDWWEAFTKAAQDSGQALSEWIGQACLAKLPPAERKRLSDRPPAHRPKVDKPG